MKKLWKSIKTILKPKSQFESIESIEPIDTIAGIDLVDNFEDDYHSTPPTFQRSELEEIAAQQDYPVYGMVTNILNEDLNNFLVELNYSIKAKVIFDVEVDDDVNIRKRNMIMKNAFEPAIYILEFTKIDLHGTVDKENRQYPIEAICHGIVFGTPNEVVNAH